jgi:hypothetical protein
MSALVPVTRLRRRVTHRLIATRYPSEGILDRVASPEDLDAVFELEGWTNDRISTELGILLRVPRDEWVIGTPSASVIMAAFCHPRPGGARFSDAARGAWYASFTLDTAHAEALYHRGRELDQVGMTDARLEMREYIATFNGPFHDVRDDRSLFRALHNPDKYEASQRFARDLFETGSNGIVYRSVRRPGGTCLACFRPALVADVRVGGHFEYRWSRGAPTAIRRMT